MSERDGKNSELPPCELPLVNIDFQPGESLESPYTQFKPDPELAAQGWERRYTADPLRADEAIQLYSELGYEVRIETVKPEEFTDACQACGLTACHTYSTIYTRKNKG
ncbi:MAG: hypothetical protein OEV06_06100 [Anaerolineae bacterium]|nr:hypothetical protein [Anaerolineae bacterium]